MATVPQGTGIPPLPQIDSDAPDAEQRHTYIGGSEAFELVGEKQYGRGCTRALAYRKLQTPEDESTKHRAISMRAIFRRGHILEDVIAKLYMEETGRSLIRRSRVVRHPDFPGAAVHTDRLILACPQEGKPTGDAEIKSHAEGPFLNILRNGLPPAHNLQLQWSLFCTQHTWGAFIIGGFFGEFPLKHFDMDRDAALMNIFADAVTNFWDGLKAGDLPPQLADASDIRCKVCPYRLTCRGQSLDPAEYRRLMAERDGKRVLTEIMNDELDQALADRSLILSELEALDSADEDDPGALQLINKRISELLGDVEAAAVNQHWKVYTHDGTWSGLDIQRLHREQPEIYEKYFTKAKPTGKKILRVYALHNGKMR